VAALTAVASGRYIPAVLIVVLAAVPVAIVTFMLISAVVCFVKVLYVPKRDRGEGG
jgi:hypothetical protein